MFFVVFLACAHPPFSISLFLALSPSYSQPSHRENLVHITCTHNPTTSSLSFPFSCFGCHQAAQTSSPHMLLPSHTPSPPPSPSLPFTVWNGTSRPDFVRCCSVDSLQRWQQKGGGGARRRRPRVSVSDRPTCDPRDPFLRLDALVALFLGTMRGCVKVDSSHLLRGGVCACVGV